MNNENASNLFTQTDFPLAVTKVHLCECLVRRAPNSIRANIQIASMYTMRHFVIIVAMLAAVGSALAQNIRSQDERVRQSFCATVGKAAAVSMQVRREGKKTVEEVKEAYEPLVDKTQRNFGITAASMLEAAVESAWDDDKKDPVEFGEEWILFCRKEFKVNI